MLTIFVTNYWQLFTLRLLTGIALGGALPVVFSLLGDLYDTSRRAGVSSMVQLATGIGLAAGQGIAGFVGPAWGWRWPFVIVSVPAVAAATFMLYTCHEPKRGGTEAALQAQFQEHSLFAYNEQLTWRKLGRLLLIPTNMLVISQGLFGCLPWGMILTYLNDYLSQNKGLSIQTATLVLLILGIGGAVGVLGGGWVGQWCYNRRKWSMPVFIGVCTVLGTLPMLWLVNADVAAVPALTVMFAFLSGALSGTVGPNMRAMMLNVNEPETRGIALALQTMLDDLGKGLGPVFVAFFIERLGRTGAFNLSTLGWVPCGLLLLGTACTLARDEAAMQHRLHKVLSSYTFSSTALDRMAEQEQEEQQQQDGEGGGGSDAWQQRHGQQWAGSSIGRHSSSGSLGIERAPP
ncbi:MFS family transporter: sugar [Chlorella sorokiniana]|uniref:MFS family transporter: sugar n=1 Tax=Chlorella sorokiniana TaxID=3076 RepID=A0A2P6TY33_CHLSO|nr:MFS family transporter: sugar [Chlorella sorokiniana]|eukprot:PRW58958.1 MFS family transporter: sugar [Chlorella sorokiniana]